MKKIITFFAIAILFSTIFLFAGNTYATTDELPKISYYSHVFEDKDLMDAQLEIYVNDIKQEHCDILYPESEWLQLSDYFEQNELASGDKIKILLNGEEFNYSFFTDQDVEWSVKGDYITSQDIFTIYNNDFTYYNIWINDQIITGKYDLEAEFPIWQISQILHNGDIIFFDVTFNSFDYRTQKQYTYIEKGDVDKDGKITTTDYLLVKLYFLKKVNLDEVQVQCADVDNNGKIDTTDYLLIKQMMMQKDFRKQKGDLNGDGKVTIEDLNLLKELTLTNNVRSSIKYEADINNDKKVDFSDYLILKKFFEAECSYFEYNDTAILYHISGVDIISIDSTKYMTNKTLGVLVKSQTGKMANFNISLEYIRFIIK